MTLQRCNLHAEVIDSVHNDQASRGSVVDQVPPAGDKVKPGRDIYLTINAFTKKQLTIPDLTGSSALPCRCRPWLRERGVFRPLRFLLYPSWDLFEKFGLFPFCIVERRQRVGFLVLRMQKASRNRIQQAAEAGCILVNGRPVKSNYRVKPLDTVQIVMDRPRYEFEIIAEDIPLDRASRLPRSVSRRVCRWDRHPAIRSSAGGASVIPKRERKCSSLLRCHRTLPPWLSAGEHTSPPRRIDDAGAWRMRYRPVHEIRVVHTAIDMYGRPYVTPAIIWSGPYSEK